MTANVDEGSRAGQSRGVRCRAGAHNDLRNTRDDIQTVDALVGAAARAVAYWGFRFDVLGLLDQGPARDPVGAAIVHDVHDAPGASENRRKRM
jgi:hypothetical protein